MKSEAMSRLAVEIYEVLSKDLGLTKEINYEP